MTSELLKQSDKSVWFFRPQSHLSIISPLLVLPSSLLLKLSTHFPFPHPQHLCPPVPLSRASPLTLLRLLNFLVSVVIPGPINKSHRDSTVFTGTLLVNCVYLELCNVSMCLCKCTVTLGCFPELESGSLLLKTPYTLDTGLEGT